MWSHTFPFTCGNPHSSSSVSVSDCTTICTLSSRPCVSWIFAQRIAVCCSVLQCVAVCCSALQCVAVCCSVLQSLKNVFARDMRFAMQMEIFISARPPPWLIFTFDDMLQWVAMCCGVLQCVAVRCSVMHCVAESRCYMRWLICHTATHYNTLQHTATHFNTLQHTATHCNTDMTDSSLLCEMTHTPLIHTWYDSLV